MPAILEELRAGELPQYAQVPNGAWKFVNLDAATGKLVVPKGSSGTRWDKQPGKWNMKLESAVDDAPYDPALTLLGRSTEVVQATFTEYGLDRAVRKYNDFVGSFERNVLSSGKRLRDKHIEIGKREIEVVPVIDSAPRYGAADEPPTPRLVYTSPDDKARSAG